MGALRRQANLARWPKQATLLPFACTEDVRAHSLRPLQAAHSSSIFAEVIRLFHSFLPCKGHRKQVGAYNAVFDDTFSTLVNGCSGSLQRRVARCAIDSHKALCVEDLSVNIFSKRF